MKFRKGCKVEVMSGNQVPMSWRCAEIISGNGRSYLVKFDHHLESTEEEAVFERVSRKAIRPCPPSIEDIQIWVAGDVVEVFNYGSWNSATVLKVLNGDCYLVRLLGPSQELRVHMSRTRARLSWQNERWVIFGHGQGSRSYQHLKPASNGHQKRGILEPKPSGMFKRRRENDAFACEVSRTLREASPPPSCHLDVYSGHFQKTRTLERDSARALEKVDAIAYPRKYLGEKSIYSSFNNRLDGFSDRKRTGPIACSLARIPEPNDSDNDACSVGSCSVASSSPDRLPENCLGNDNSHFMHKKIDDSVHTLELHAYRCTLEALYASGPLSWEQEALLTDLRITLHISNDEHLVELRKFLLGETHSR
ncbi:uncharacterized protein LOC124932482 [Impatiens glandulifera]|uniref:uncharacterized protein LOC124932482 n=1 Tax=Impatiens glandulifera TaxID=253017 RepID=UPI001FB063AE|nr:uncharacterized protein LOC124932482 [Impatiens glandulifera]